jgi:hypothetical protein
MIVLLLRNMRQPTGCEQGSETSSQRDTNKPRAPAMHMINATRRSQTYADVSEHLAFEAAPIGDGFKTG